MVAVDVASSGGMIGGVSVVACEGSICGTHDSPIPKISALNLEVLCRRFSFVRNFVVFDNLALIQIAEAGLLDSRDMDKHIFSAAILRLNKSVPFLRIEPLHGVLSR